MECFLGTLLLLSLSLSISFVSGKNHSLSNDHDLNEESITVRLKAYKEEVLQCMIHVETNKDGFNDYFPLYEKDGLINFEMFNYIGDTDNSCSFVIYPKHDLFKTYFNDNKAFQGKWTIIEKYSCDKSFWNIVTFVYDLQKEGCYRKYNIFFNPTTNIEVMSMTFAATKIIRKAPYDNETLTVFVQSEKQPISMCRLYIGYNPSTLSWSNDIIIYDKYRRSSPPAELGIEYIGFNDNSCSVKIHLEVLNTTYNENNILNRDWVLVAMHDNNHHYEEKNSKYSFYVNPNEKVNADDSTEDSIYSFYMNSKNWWNNNHYSKIFLRKKFPFSTDVQPF